MNKMAEMWEMPKGITPTREDLDAVMKEFEDIKSDPINDPIVHALSQPLNTLSLLMDYAERYGWNEEHLKMYSTARQKITDKINQAYSYKKAA